MSEKKLRINSLDKREKEFAVSFIEPSSPGAVESSFGIAPFPDSDNEETISDDEQDHSLTPDTRSHGSDSPNNSLRAKRISVSAYRQPKIPTNASENNSNSNNGDTFGSQSSESSGSYNSNAEFGSESLDEEKDNQRQVTSTSEKAFSTKKLTRSLSEFSEYFLKATKYFLAILINKKRKSVSTYFVFAKQTFINIILEIGNQRISSPGLLRRHVPGNLQNSKSSTASAPSSPKVQHAGWSPSNSPGVPSRSTRDSIDVVGKNYLDPPIHCTTFAFYNIIFL